MQITLNDRPAQFIAEQLARGNFTHPDEVVSVALRLLEKLQTEYGDWLAETREKVEVAALELERGEGLDGETFVLEILERLQNSKNWVSESIELRRLQLLPEIRLINHTFKRVLQHPAKWLQLGWNEYKSHSSATVRYTV